MVSKKGFIVILILSISFFSDRRTVSNAYNVSCNTSDDADFDTSAHMTARNPVIGVGTFYENIY